MDKSPFLITGTGRSGTLFLAETLNRSSTWNVTHEHPNDHRYWESPTERNADELIARFGSESYGEVNSQLRRIAPALSRRGLRVYFIVRRPQDIIKSVHKARERSADQFEETLTQILPALTDVFLLKLLGFKYFKFEEFTTNKKHLYDMASEIGVNDVPISKVDLSVKVNTNGPGTIDDWNIGMQNVNIFLDKCGWFMRAFRYRQ